MTVEELEALFEKHSDEYIKFDRIENPRHKRPDMNAFLLLDELVPGDRDMICDSQHDEFHLSVETEELAEVVSESQVIELIRCGVRVGEYGLCMFA